MSVSALNKIVVDKIISRFESTKDLFRYELDAQIHVMSIDRQTLLKNNPKIPQKGAKMLTRAFIRAILKANPKITMYDGTKEVTKLSYIMENDSSMLLIAPSFRSIRRAISKASSHSSIKNNPYIGTTTKKYIDQETGEEKTSVGSLIDIGHTAQYGSKNINIRESKNTVVGARLSDALSAGKKEAADLGIKFNDRKISPIFNRYMKRLDYIHSKYRAEFNKELTNKLSGKFSFVFVVPQNYESNRNVLGPLERKITIDIMKDLENLKGSKSLKNMIFSKLENIFLEKPDKPYKSKAKVSGNMKVKTKSRKINSKSVSIRLRDKRGKFTSTLSLQTLMNNMLHDQIQSNMGKGRATEILNYRTGRFARSAKIISINQDKNKLIANYTFMRYPYDVFMPGGKLYKPGRNPEKLINRSIRQLATKLISNKFKVYPNLVEV